MRTSRSVATAVVAALALAVAGVGAVRNAAPASASARPPDAPLEIDRVVADRAPLVAAAATNTGAGYWLFLRDGAVVPFGDARAFSQAASVPPGAPVVGAATTSDSNGYWQLRSDGGVFAFGDARFYGSARGLRLNQATIGLTATSTGQGYWLLARDGGIFSYGDAHFYGSTGSLKLNRPIISMAATPTGHGYWLLASDGGIFSYGDAQFYGSVAATVPGGVRAIVAAPAGGGYWLFTGHGGVLAFGRAAPLGTVIRPHAGTSPRPRVAYYGDSLVTQSETDLALLGNLGHWDVSLHDFPGTALCDYLDQMSSDAVNAPPDVAVIAFSGNALTPCMFGPGRTFLADPAIAVRYHESAEVAVALFAAEGTRVVLVGGPPFYGSEGESGVNRAYMAVAAEHPHAAEFADAGAAVAGPGRKWVKTLPCLPYETSAMGCRGGQIIVRAPDTVHFCPGQAIVTSTWRMLCPVWSSGAWRYSMGLTAGATAGLRESP